MSRPGQSRALVLALGCPTYGCCRIDLVAVVLFWLTLAITMISRHRCHASVTVGTTQQVGQLGHCYEKYRLDVHGEDQLPLELC